MAERMISAAKLVTVLARKFRNKGMIHYDDLMAVIADVPSVEAVEVVHARWIYEDDTVMKWTTKAICSACNCVVAQSVELAHEYGRENHEKENNYCPHCGAKMDGGNEDGTAED